MKRIKFLRRGLNYLGRTFCLNKKTYEDTEMCKKQFITDVNNAFGLCISTNAELVCTDGDQDDVLEFYVGIVEEIEEDIYS